ncbi:MAG: hypothetical protein ACE5KK_01580 [Candidatus Brocadiales bacterium]
MEKVLMSCIMSLFLCLSPSNLHAIQPDLTNEEIEEAIKYGEKNSRTIFKTLLILPACLEAWPGLDSGLVRSKFVDLAVKAARKKRHNQKITEDEIKEASASETLEVLIRTRDDVAIKLIQRDKMIEPVSISYLDHHCEWCDFYGGEASKETHEYVIASFPYLEIIPNTITTVIVWDGGYENQYEINLSRFK